MTQDDERRRLEDVVASGLAEFLREVPVGAEFTPPEARLFWGALERYLPMLLGEQNSGWAGEGIDGFRLSFAQRLDESSVYMVGVCILISDQTVAPFAVRLAADDHWRSIAACSLALGESGDGALGISGPSCNSGQADRLLNRIRQRVETGSMDWTFRVEYTGRSTGASEPDGLAT